MRGWREAEPPPSMTSASTQDDPSLSTPRVGAPGLESWAQPDPKTPLDFASGAGDPQTWETGEALGGREETPGPAGQPFLQGAGALHLGVPGLSHRAGVIRGATLSVGL